MTFKNEWFHGPDCIKLPPNEAIIDCSRPGACDEAVAHWVKRLRFDGPAWLFREFLGECGCWSERELCDHKENIQRVFWIICGNLNEEYDVAGNPDMTLPDDATLFCYLGL